MQEIRNDGSEHLTPKASWETILDALKNPANKHVVVYPPGSIIESGERRYYVEADGALTYLEPKAEAQARHADFFRDVEAL